MKLACRYGVSRPRLYKLRDRLWETLVEAMQPRPAGRPAQTTTLRVDRDFINRVIVTLPLLKGTVRDIRLDLHLLLGITCSVDNISQAFAVAGEQAQVDPLSLRLPLPILGKADEIFQGRQPCFPIMDGRFFLVMNRTLAASRDATT